MYQLSVLTSHASLQSDLIRSFFASSFSSTLNFSRPYSSLTRGRLDQLENTLALLGSRLETLNPYGVLKRGYSVVLDTDGKTVTGADELSEGDLLRLRFERGEAKVRVEDAGQRN